ncbi:MBL fold metallo-hydrolase [Patescibacteria group bacterium]|nr:MBL fold metallo-hydrolase [Patescibacteria group bacterium]
MVSYFGMELTYFGHSCFKLKTKSVVLVIDPYDPEKLGLKLPKLEADVVLLTHDHFDHNYREGVTGHRLIIDGPGEYEVGGVSISGIPVQHDEKEGKERGANTMYYIEAAGVTVLHCGDLGHVLDEATLAKFGQVTALLVPVGGTYTIDAETAAKVISSIEPAYVVPMHYRLPGTKVQDLNTLDQFLDEMGLDQGKVGKSACLTLTESDNENETQVIVLDKS